MRYVVVLIVSIFALTCTPGLVSAQGLFGCSDVGSSGGLPILGKLFGKKKKADSCYDDPPRGGGLALYVGYLANDEGLAFDVSNEGIIADASAQFRVRYPLSGVLFAASGTIPITKRLDILVNGSWLLPSQGGDATRISRNANSDSTWSTKNQWWNAGAAATFNIAGPFSAIGGFLVDSFSTNFSNPTNVTGTAVTPDDEADLTVGTVIPYFGGLLTQGGPAGSLTIGMIGTPIIFGSARYTLSFNQGAATSNQFDISGGINSGYFFEIFAETSMNIRAMSFGIFGGWNITQATMDMDFEFNQGFVAPASVTQPYSGAFYRSAWVLGGKFALDFVTPL